MDDNQIKRDLYPLKKTITDGTWISFENKILINFKINSRVRN